MKQLKSIEILSFMNIIFSVFLMYIIIQKMNKIMFGDIYVRSGSKNKKNSIKHETNENPLKKLFENQSKIRKRNISDDFTNIKYNNLLTQTKKTPVDSNPILSLFKDDVFKSNALNTIENFHNPNEKEKKEEKIRDENEVKKLNNWDGNIDSDESNNSAVSDISYISRLSSSENDRNFLSTDKETKQFNGKKKLNLKTLNRKRDEGIITLIKKWD
jgi:hypothetical protein